MLARARRQVLALNLDGDLRQMDTQHLTFPDNSFDAVVATFVFCSVPKIKNVSHNLRCGSRSRLRIHHPRDGSLGCDIDKIFVG
jgi:hypothetical protein